MEHYYDDSRAPRRRRHAGRRDAPGAASEHRSQLSIERTPLPRRATLRWPNERPLAFAMLGECRILRDAAARECVHPAERARRLWPRPISGLPRLHGARVRQPRRHLPPVRGASTGTASARRSRSMLDREVLSGGDRGGRQARIRNRRARAGRDAGDLGQYERSRRAGLHQRFARRAIEAAAGRRPAGWHGPEYGESARTPTLLAELGVRYVLDWPNDEQPYTMTTTAGPITSVTGRGRLRRRLQPFSPPHHHATLGAVRDRGASTGSPQDGRDSGRAAGAQRASLADGASVPRDVFRGGAAVRSRGARTYGSLPPARLRRGGDLRTEPRSRQDKRVARADRRANPSPPARCGPSRAHRRGSRA